MTNWLKLAVLVVAAVVVTQLLVRGSHRSTVAPAGSPAPALVLPDLEGRSLDLGSLKGKVVAVNFWATWCPPCRRELPDLAAFYQAQRGRCFEMLGVAEESGRGDVAAAARQIPYPVLLDETARALEPWGVQGYPATFVVDAEGHVRHVFRGEIDGAELADAVAPLLPKTCPRG
ncbi:TlpA family protein disulfide reductase [Anaeromyxobacter oryzisoli]|jgi:cytochrome c biogenesis protein CcmG, thiol:disulfide interchange protein DsbE|uniref:TlpA family protein disulfide reductase n=1 Tax=Anaeromyxobacter oryzisoli TaxID=2925408 RepID=UPI001F588626|nr:TlpA disulfide reductase family protein [Anaeromyxobacter sp. SG63]